MKRHLPLTLAGLLGVGAAANGIFMLLSPANWYFAVPGVTTTVGGAISGYWATGSVG